MTAGGDVPEHRTWVGSDRFIPRRFVQPMIRFTEIEAASGVLMLVAAVVAIVWANAPFGESYARFWDAHVVLGAGRFSLDQTLEGVVNDGLMTIFFFVVALEIKREMVLGELRDPKHASLPVLAALGGMLVPALIYTAMAGHLGPDYLRGWGVPVATDIAFSVGVLSLLGKRVPTGAKLFLLTLAIADDLGGIIVIAVFYTEQLRLLWLGTAAAGLALVFLAHRVGVRSFTFYLPVGVAIWFCFLQSGVHPTLSGVALAFLTPAFPMYDADELDRKARRILDTYPPASAEGGREHAEYEALLLATVARESVAPLRRLEDRLETWSSFFIVPVFALANAGVRFAGASVTGALISPIALGVGLGLLLGKPIGISLFTWLSVRLGLGKLPQRTSWHHMIGVATTAGVGFTVALFITALAFNRPDLADDAKVGIFAGSLLAGVIGLSILARARPVPRQVGELRPGDDAEVPA